MRLTRKVYETQNDKTSDFLIGFIGWYLINLVVGGALWFGNDLLNTAFYSSTGYGETAQTIISVIGIVCTCLPFLYNAAALIYFGLTRYWFALGALAAFASALVLALCAALLFGAACFVILTGMEGGFNP